MNAPDQHSNIVSTLRDYIERSTHWAEGGADRHSALQALNALPDAIDWLEKGNAEWRSEALQAKRHAEAARATARIAIGHLQAVLNTARTHADQQAADTAARDWLISIGSEPA
jgi:hypothetical protein